MEPVQETAEPKVKASRQVRSVNVRLDGQGESLHLRAFRTRNGWRTETIHIVGVGKAAKRKRGITADHADEAAARVALDKLAGEAAKLGWAPRPARSFTRAADSFATLPKPKAKK